MVGRTTGSRGVHGNMGSQRKYQGLEKMDLGNPDVSKVLSPKKFKIFPLYNIFSIYHLSRPPRTRRGV